MIAREAAVPGGDVRQARENPPGISSRATRQEGCSYGSEFRLLKAHRASDYWRIILHGRRHLRTEPGDDAVFSSGIHHPRTLSASAA